MMPGSSRGSHLSVCFTAPWASATVISSGFSVVHEMPHMTRYHGVFAPASPDRARVVPGVRAAAANNTNDCGEVSAIARQRSLSWAQRLKRVFAIDIEVCRRCGGRLRVIASIEDPEVIERILEHLGRDAGPVDPAHPCRAPPQGELSC
jgi:hypothetical protein